MPRQTTPFHRGTDVDAVRKISADQQWFDQTEGIVASVDAAGSVKVRINGSASFTPVEVGQGMVLSAGNRVILRRSSTNGRWVVYGTYGIAAAQGAVGSISITPGGGTGTGSGDTSAPGPSDLVVVGVEDGLEIRWTPPGAHPNLLYEVEVADDTSETNAVTYTVAGSDLFLSLTSGLTRYVRVRSLSASWDRSGWIGWVSGTSLQGGSNARILIEIGW